MTHETITNALAQWTFNVASSFLPKVKIMQTSAIGRMMTVLGIDLSRYNPWNELGFLAEPVIETMLTPVMSKYLSGFSEEQLSGAVNKIVDSCIAQAKEKGYVNVFGIQLGQDAFEGLKELLNDEDDTRSEGQVQ